MTARFGTEHANARKTEQTGISLSACIFNEKGYISGCIMIMC